MSRKSISLLRNAFLAVLGIYALSLAVTPSTLTPVAKQAEPQASGPDGAIPAIPAKTRDARETKSTPAVLSRTLPANGFSGFTDPGDAAETGSPAPVRVTVENVLPDAVKLPKSDEAEWVVVDAPALNLRAGPSISTDRVTSLPRGTRLAVLTRKEQWVQVQNPETGQTGWMYRDYLKSAPRKAPKTGIKLSASRDRSGT
jgi:uncharacterized protein YgiM (DUF1202 family)